MLTMKLCIAVVGAGPIGLGAAVNIQDRLPQANITVVAEKFSPNTTGDCAAGLVIPHALADTPTHKIREWIGATTAHCAELYSSEEAPECGVSYTSGFLLSPTRLPEPGWRDAVAGFRHATSQELSRYSGQYETAWFFSTYLLDCNVYLQWLTSKFLRRGGQVEQRKIRNLDELYAHYDVIVNCTGVGAYDLGDTKVTPIRGQIVRVKAPWVNQFVIVHDECHIIPGIESVTLGGVHQDGNWDLKPNQDDREGFVRACTKLLPGLKSAPVVSEWVGLRPGRHAVRLEFENVRQGDRTIKLVHNYGHGGAGVGLHWGCGVEAAMIVCELIGESANLQHTSKL